MRYTKLFGKTSKTVPVGAEAVSHILLARGGFIDQLAAGIYSFLPLGWRVHQKIADIIREEMNNIDAQELFMPTLQPKALWMESDRWDKMDPPLFKLTDRHEKEYALGSTHEEVITDLVRRKVNSYKDLPLALYQIQNKFRNEVRSTGGLLRVREFVMKDLYSFHTTPEDLGEYFQKVLDAYKKIFKRCGLEIVISEASGGSIGGSETYEFHVLTPVGEDRVKFCPACRWAANVEIEKKDTCPKCGKTTKESSAIEVAHVFSLGTKYSQKLKATFIDKDGEKKLIWMGCYGIGVGRLMATIVEASHDDKGIVWPAAVAPFEAHLIGINSSMIDDFYHQLTGEGIEVLYDDREVGPGEKFADADLIGLPVRLVISEKNGGKV